MFNGMLGIFCKSVDHALVADNCCGDGNAAIAALTTRVPVLDFLVVIFVVRVNRLNIDS